MKPPPFAYLRPGDLGSALAALERFGDDARPLAGGQSLVPMLNFRLARPGVLVDLGRIPGLAGIEVVDGEVRLGAMTRQAAAERDPAVGAALPLVRRALSHVGHPQIRSQGTIGGSIAHADPAAELPAVALALDARLDVATPGGGRRTIAAQAAFVGPFQTALAPGELLTGVRIPTAGIRAWGFEEVARRHGDYALAGVVAVRRDAGWRLVAFGMGWVPVRLRRAEAILDAGPDAGPDPGPGWTDRAQQAAEAAASEVDPMDDIHADAAYRRDAVRALVVRSVGGRALGGRPR